MSRPVPVGILLLLLAGLCGLCAWQWKREALLRDLTRRQLAELGDLRKALQENATRAKTADAEILRLTEALADIKTASVSKTQYDETTASAKALREGVLKQNAALKEQQEALLKANAAVAQANQSIQKLTAERNGLAEKLSALSLQYNKLVKRLQNAPPEAAPADAEKNRQP